VAELSKTPIPNNAAAPGMLCEQGQNDCGNNEVGGKNGDHGGVGFDADQTSRHSIAMLYGL